MRALTATEIAAAVSKIEYVNWSRVLRDAGIKEKAAKAIVANGAYADGSVVSLTQAQREYVTDYIEDVRHTLERIVEQRYYEQEYDSATRLTAKQLRRYLRAKYLS